MRDLREIIAGLIIVICCIVGMVLISGFLSYIIYSVVMATDWPDWVKYWILH